MPDTANTSMRDFAEYRTVETDGGCRANLVVGIGVESAFEGDAGNPASTGIVLYRELEPDPDTREACAAEGVPMESHSCVDAWYVSVVDENDHAIELD
jgi:hypothetical protein